LSSLISTSVDTSVARLPRPPWIQRFASAARLRSFGKRVAISRFDQEFPHRTGMFKISTVDTPSQRTLVVEGTLVGLWVAELRTTWRNAKQELGERKLVIDLSDLTVIGCEGKDAILDLMNQGAEFSRGGILTRHVLKQLARKKLQELPRR
jgi:hypothetical protein